MVMELMLMTAAADSPSRKIINCERRLYQPETRSIVLLNQFSTLSRNFCTSFPAISNMAVSAFLTLVLSILAIALGIVPAGSFDATMDMIARAKFRDGM